MNIPTSEGNSSGCESGWTMYLDHSADNRHQLQKHGSTTTTVGYDEDDEDLSMVSDASSGPPNFHEDDHLYSSFDHESGYNFAYGSSASQQARQEGKKIKKNKNQHGKDKQLCLPSYLDDTASSPIKEELPSRRPWAYHRVSLPQNLRENLHCKITSVSSDPLTHGNQLQVQQVIYREETGNEKEVVQLLHIF